MVGEVRQILDSAPIPILVANAAGKVLFANPPACEMFGRDLPALKRKSLQKLLPISDISDIPDARAAEATTGSMAPLQISNGKSDRIFVEARANRWVDDDGEDRFTIVLRDVTEQQSIEGQLRNTLEHWDYALTGANIGLFEVDVTTGVSQVSKTWRTIMEVGEEVDAQSEWLGRVHPDDLQAVLDADKACIKGDSQRSNSEYRIKNKDGSKWLWMRSEAVVPKRDARGRALRLIGTQTEITAMKEAEEALRLSKEQFQSAFNNAPIGKAVMDLQGGFHRVNRAACNLLGYTEEQLLKTDLQSLIHKDDKDVDSGQMSQLKSGEITSFSSDKRLVRLDGAVITGQLTIALVNDRDGKPDHLIAQIVDLSEQRKLDLLKREFVAVVSHELRTPVTSIVGSLGLVAALQSKEFSDETSRLLYIAQKNSERLRHLVDDILDFEKYSNGNMHFALSRQNVVQLLEQTIMNNIVFAEEHGARLVLKKADRSLLCKVDPDRFQQVVTNLLSNAAKFSDKGSPIEIGAVRSGEYAKVSITNRGPVISEEFHDALFQPFSQLEPSSTRKNNGTGLGLSISKLIVERMRGEIGLESGKGKTTFWFTSPVGEATA